MIAPVRIQRTRKSKQVSPNGLPIVYVGRPSRWGNPYRVGVDGDAMQCIRKYHDDINPYRHHGKTSSLEHFYISEANIKDIQSELRGKNLSCWCSLDQPCHADLLLKFANEEIYS